MKDTHSPLETELITQLGRAVLSAEQALRQWDMYADLDGKELDTDICAESVLYRACVADVKQARAALERAGREGC